MRFVVVTKSEHYKNAPTFCWQESSKLYAAGVNNFETDVKGFCDAQSIHYMDIFAPQAPSLLALIFRIFSKAE